MDQNGGALDSARKADPAEPNDPRPMLPERAESSLPPHLRPSVIEVPVTPDITEANGKSNGDDTGEPGEPGYFSRHDVDHAIAASPGPNSTNREGQSFQNKIDVGAKEGSDFMRRLSVAVMGSPTNIAPSLAPGPEISTRSRESMSDIRAISPDLALTGNIISATFNIPHSLKYRKGADWVCTFFLFISLHYFTAAIAPQRGCDTDRHICQAS